MTVNWREALAPPTATISEALRVLDNSGLRMVMVTDDDERLLGLITDGDIRRALLRRVDLGCLVTEVMNCHPLTAQVNEPRDTLRAVMEHHSILYLPLVDGGGRVVGLETYHHLLSQPQRENWVFLMAGGVGKRLRPLTDACPKPMLLVEGKPILQSILERFAAAGFRYFYISVYYLADQIKAHFGDGARWGVTIRYVEETSPLGTAGALGLLPEVGELPVIVMNGDVLTHLDLNAMLDFHNAQQALLTLCVREYEMHVPFGVVEGLETQVTHIVEKPVHRFFVNAGIYVVAPEVIRRVRPPRRIDMPDLVDSLIAEQQKVSMFPIHEYWLDVGRPDDYARAQKAGVVTIKSDYLAQESVVGMTPAADTRIKRVCVVTGSRADYGLLYFLLCGLRDDPCYELQLLVTGMHLSPEFGMTVKAIEADGFAVTQRIETLLSSDSAVGIAKATGLGLLGFADALQNLKPDLLVVLGDRFEIFAAAQAALFMRIPIAHIGGGDVTAGAFDEAMRHSISKLAQLHFVTNGDAARRLVRMGEHPNHVFNVGSPGLDHLHRAPVLDKATLEGELDFRFRARNFLVTFHPVTLDVEPSEQQIGALFEALEGFCHDTGILLTLPNADTEGRALIEAIRRFAAGRDNVRVYPSLGQRRYLGALAAVDVVIGNSSSGLYEAPSLRTPTVNIGRRQEGRLRAASVFDCLPTRVAIGEAIDRALAFGDQAVLNPYQRGDCADLIKEQLDRIDDFQPLLMKGFYKRDAEC